MTAGATSYDSRHGRWAVDWEVDGGRWRLDVEVPAGCVASVHLPGGGTCEITAGRWGLGARQEMERR